MRLPSLLSLVVYLWYSWRITARWAGTDWMALAGFIFFISNRYLLDFFSLARGYALAVTMMVVSLYYLGRYLEKPALKWLIWNITGAALAVLANFTMLPYLAGLCVLLLGFWIFEWKNIKQFLPHIWWHPGLLLLSYTVVAFLIFRPIGFLLAKEEFEYGEVSLIATFKSLIINSLYGVRYVHMYNIELFALPMFLILFSASVLVFWKIKNRKLKKADRLLVAVLIMGLFIT